MRSLIGLCGIIAVVALAGVKPMTAPAAQASTGGQQASWVPCSTDALTAAINRANNDGGGTLTLSGLCDYVITTPATASDGLPVITTDIRLTGGADTVISRAPAAAAAFRILEVAAGGTLTLTGISIRNGSTAGLGGGIENAGTLRLDQVILSGNRAGNGGAVANSHGATASLVSVWLTDNTTTGVGGGGIINSGMLTLSGGIVSGNSAPINGGGLNTQPSAISTIEQSTFIGNTAGALGGAISNLGTTSLDRTVVRGNKGSSGGGIATGNKNVTLHHSTISGNTPNNCNPLNSIPGCAGLRGLPERCCIDPHRTGSLSQRSGQSLDA
jgi:hypothetical protein